MLRIIGKAPEIDGALEGLVVALIESAHQFLRAQQRIRDLEPLLLQRTPCGWLLSPPVPITCVRRISFFAM